MQKKIILRLSESDKRFHFFTAAGSQAKLIYIKDIFFCLAYISVPLNISYNQ